MGAVDFGDWKPLSPDSAAEVLAGENISKLSGFDSGLATTEGDLEDQEGVAIRGADLLAESRPEGLRTEPLHVDGEWRIQTLRRNDEALAASRVPSNACHHRLLRPGPRLVQPAHGRRSDVMRAAGGRAVKVEHRIGRVMAESPHAIRIGDVDVQFRSKVADIVVDVPDGRPGARYVYTEYVRLDHRGNEPRPVLFAFNGGPGSSPLWLHFGFGPRRVGAADTLRPRMTPPFTLVDNGDSLLDAADLVFVDPPGTGFSRLSEGIEPSAFYGTEPDARGMLDFIDRWTRANQREQSPRFLLGESYGAMRAARMIRDSLGGPRRGGFTRSATFNGVVIVGPDLAFGVSDYVGDTMCAVETATLAATAWYHELAGRETSLERHVARAREFGTQTLLPALARGSSLSDSEVDVLANELAEVIGLGPRVVREHRFRISPSAYARLALAERGLHLGIFDSRYTLPAAEAGEDPVADDPAMGQYVPSFTGAIESYLRDELESAYEGEYRAINFAGVNGNWDWGNGADLPTSGAFAEFAQGLRRDPRLELLVVVGMYDLATTAAAAEYAVNRHEIDHSRVHLVRLESGHMSYLGESPRRTLAAEIRSFVTRLSS